MQAIIFDMDGVLVDSEPIWQEAERVVFSSLGVPMNSELCALTQKMTTEEVTKFWYQRAPWSADISLETVEKRVIQAVKEQIKTRDCIIPGVQAFIQIIKDIPLKIGLATNAPDSMIPIVLNKLEAASYFDVYCSSDQVQQGKPMPDVYLKAITSLGIPAHQCLAIEDSNSGIQAAQAAGMKTAAFTNNGRNTFSETADYTIAAFTSFQIEQIINPIS